MTKWKIFDNNYFLQKKLRRKMKLFRRIAIGLLLFSTTLLLGDNGLSEILLDNMLEKWREEDRNRKQMPQFQVSKEVNHNFLKYLELARQYDNYNDFFYRPVDIIVENDTSTPIMVSVVCYHDYMWQTKTMELESGEDFIFGKTTNCYFFYYATYKDGSGSWKGDKLYLHINYSPKLYGFRRKKIKGSYTLSLTD